MGHEYRNYCNFTWLRKIFCSILILVQLRCLYYYKGNFFLLNIIENYAIAYRITNLWNTYSEFPS